MKHSDLLNISACAIRFQGISIARGKSFFFLVFYKFQKILYMPAYKKINRLKRVQISSYVKIELYSKWRRRISFDGEGERE